MQSSKRGNLGTFDAHDWKVGIVVAEFNTDITGQLLESALKRAEDYGLSRDEINVVHVAGAMEIPLALQHLAASGRYRALLAIGCVILGDTPHFDYVCKFATEGILRVQLDHRVPVGFGVLTCNNKEQAEARAGLGSEHLDAALQLAKVLEG